MQKNMNTNIVAGDIVAITVNYYSEPYRISKGTEFEVELVDKQSIPYKCKCLTMPVSLWLRKDQIKLVAKK